MMLEFLVVGTWIGFVAYAAWFLSSAKREREEVQKLFSDVAYAHTQRTSYSFVDGSTRSGHSFVNGLAIGLGVAFLETFIILWMSIFYASQLSAEISYEKMIAAAIYPMLFILTTGMVILTTGIVREYVRSRTSG